MTQCKRDPMWFPSLGRKKIEADFAGGCLTSGAGALLLREVDRRLSVIDALNTCIPDPRDKDSTIHCQRDLLAQRIFAIAVGYEGLIDHEILRNDPALQLAANRKPDNSASLDSVPMLCRFENHIDRNTLVKLSSVFVEQVIASHSELPRGDGVGPRPTVSYSVSDFHYSSPSFPHAVSSPGD